MITFFVNTLNGDHCIKVIKHDLSDVSEALFKSDFIMMDKNYRFKKRKKVLMTLKNKD